MNMNRTDMTEDAKYKDYTNSSLQTDSNPVGFILFLMFLRLHGYRKRKMQQSCGLFGVTTA